MDNSNMPVITISRQYYAGGRSIAKKLSELLDIPWYDDDLAKLVAEASGYTKDAVLDSGEEIGRLEHAIEKMLTGASFFTSSHDEIYKAEKKVILDLAASPCIIVGRGANAILREAAIRSFDIFLYADLMVRIERTKQTRDVNETQARDFLVKHDRFRSLYYNKYTGKTYGDPGEYTICLNTGEINYDHCGELLAGMIRSYCEWNIDRTSMVGYLAPFGKGIEKGK